MPQNQRIPAGGMRPRHRSQLANQHDIETLRAQVEAENFERTTVSFYRYVSCNDPYSLRNDLFSTWSHLSCLGRVYLAREGINGQMSIPEPQYDLFVDDLLGRYPNLAIKRAIKETAPSFYKLVVKVRNKIVADGLDDVTFDSSNVGKHLSAEEWHQAMDDQKAIVVDVRNHYESEVGHFEGALRPDVDTFRQELPVIQKMLAGKEDHKILLYCTGGIRCEKTSAWLKHKGFSDVNQLHGGIIDYTRQIKERDLPSRFRGKNFVFDGRLGEPISEEIISRCHQCGKPSDSHTNCAWDGCHLLFIQCPSCSQVMDGCCSPECQDILHLPEEEKSALRKGPDAQQGFLRSRRRVDSSVRLRENKE